MLIGGRQMIVISSPDGIAALLQDQHKVFKSDEQYVEVMKAITGLERGVSDLQKILHYQLAPLAGRIMAKTSIHKFTPKYVERLLQEMSVFAARSEKGTKALSLEEIVGRCQLAATAHALFGSSFTDDIHDDMSCLHESIYSKMHKVPYYWPPSRQAQRRLIVRLSDYIVRAEAGGADGAFTTHLINVFKTNNLALEEKAGLLLVILYASYSSPMHTTFWTLTEILADQKLAARLYEEVDNVVRAHAVTENGDAPSDMDLPTLLRADPHVLDGPGLPLLDSVIQETMRLRLASTILRRASCDTVLDVDVAAGQRLVVHKGEYVLAHTAATQWDERWYEQPDKFLPDRYMSGMGGDNSTLPKQTTPPFFGWGGGRDMCRGRHLAIYEMKLVTALCVHHFRITHADVDKHGVGLRPMDPMPPRVKRHSFAVQQPECDVMVFMNVAKQ